MEQNYGTKYHIVSIGREILLEYWRTLGIFEIRKEDCWVWDEKNSHGI